jgi:DNA-binding MarR family transcriptional regulator
VLSITVGGTSKLVDRIEAAGLWRRLANPGDSRWRIIELTPAGGGCWRRRPNPLKTKLQTRLQSVVRERALGQFGATLVKLRAANRPVMSREETSSTSCA